MAIIISFKVKDQRISFVYNPLVDGKLKDYLGKKRYNVTESIKGQINKILKKQASE